MAALYWNSLPAPLAPMVPMKPRFLLPLLLAGFGAGIALADDAAPPADEIHEQAAASAPAKLPNVALTP